MASIAQVQIEIDALLVEQNQNFRGLLLWALYHHQGGSSEVGQPIRRALEIGQHDPLTEEQIAMAKKAAGVAGHDYPACALFRGGGRCTCDAADGPKAPDLTPNAKLTGLAPGKDEQ